MTLGQRIKERRQFLGLTQRDLANFTQMTVQHISAMEQDKRAPSLPLLIKLSEQLRVSIDYLVMGKEPLTDVISAIRSDEILDSRMKKSLTNLVTLMWDIMKGR
jgi:transcriptional regulator with XRE-family HTH domain